MSEFRDEVSNRFGVLPNFFCSAQAASGLIERLWDFAKSGYLDNPLPSLFKERLFVHLSRFCTVRYCIVRHVGFLVGHGRPAGDASVEPETVEQVVTLLQRRIPDAKEFEAILARLNARPAVAPIPAPRTEFEDDLFDALTAIFLVPLVSGRAREAVRTAVGDANLELLIAFLTFIRAAHYWTETHHGIDYEADILTLMELHPELRDLLVDPSINKETRGVVERTQVLNALRESEERFDAIIGTLEHSLRVQQAEVGELGRYRLLVESVTDYAIYMLDTKGFIVSWNSGARRLKGYQEAEILGQHFSRFYTQEDRSAGLPATVLATAAIEGKYEAEGWRVRKDGSQFWANVIVDPIRDPEGNLLGYAKITRDLSERRAIEATLEDARTALDRAREALFQSQKMEAIGQLAGGIAHDFNNLLTAVIGSLEIAARRASDASVKRLINNALHGAQRGAALTQRMLIFARRQELHRESIDIPKLVSGMTELLDRSLGPTVLIETRFSFNLPQVTTDPNQLEMALINLLVNARDAMSNGGPIVIAARPETLAQQEGLLPPGSYVCLSVTDTGEGMDEDTLAKATEPFFTTKEIGKGTGLGLPMVHGLAQESGGAFILKSKKGQGTTAELWLPVVDNPSVAASAEALPVASQRAPALTALVVDDDPLVLTNMVAMLEDLGHTVFETSSAREALAILRRESAIQLVLTDQAMPHMNGLELIEEIKRDWPNVRVILATGFANLPPDIDPLLVTLAKPFLQYDLEQAVKTVLSDPKTRRVVRFRGR